MKRTRQYAQGYRAAIKDAAEWLAQRADEMNDPKAKGVLNSAAFWLGNDGAVARDRGMALLVKARCSRPRNRAVEDLAAERQEELRAALRGAHGSGS